MYSTFSIQGGLTSFRVVLLICTSLQGRELDGGLHGRVLV